MTTANELVFDLEDLTIGEIEEVEDLLDSPISEAFGEGKRQGKALRAIAYVVNRRTNPDFTWEDAGALKLNLKSDGADPT